MAQAPGVLSGGEAARAIARAAGLTAHIRVLDGSAVRPGQVVMTLDGDAHRIFAAERSILNVLMHASGIATATARAVRGTWGSRGRLEVWATRKTLPGLRDLEKAAVVDGGGFRRARRGERVEVEVRTPEEALRAARAGAGALLIDNASPTRARAIVRALEGAGLRSGRWVELSGGITPETVGRYRQVGADAVSLGALTHSAAALPFHLRLEPVALSRLRP
jgi:nicotinate-nucleotide pyrophosphorylase (carboxylating)